MTKLKIKVTRKEIMAGTRCNTSACAIALSIRDIFPDAHVGADAFNTGVIGSVLGIIDLPEEAQDFIYNFDTTLPSDRASIPEIEFEIEIPDEVINSINIDSIRPLLINHPNLQLC